jgi:hypothetical protein
MNTRHTISLSKQFAFLLVLPIALLLMGAKWEEKSIDSLASIAGTWSGNGNHPRGANYSVEYVFKADGSFDFSWVMPRDAKEGHKRPGTMWIQNGKLEWKTDQGPWIFTLYEDKKGRRTLRGKRSDGNTQELSPAKK